MKFVHLRIVAILTLMSFAIPAVYQNSYATAWAYLSALFFSPIVLWATMRNGNTLAIHEVNLLSVLLFAVIIFQNVKPYVYQIFLS